MKTIYQKSKIKSLRNTRLSLVMLFTLLTASTFAQQPDFSGTWKLNKEKSDFGGLPDSVVAARIFVEKQEHNLLIKRFFSHTIAYSYSESLPFSGALSEPVKIREYLKVAKLQWQPEKMIEIGKTTGGTGDDVFEIQTTEIWSRSEDKKQLIIDRNLSQGDEKATNHLIYDKQ